MKIILLVDVKNLGKANDIVEVNDGYAKNFLIKQKLAVQYSNKSEEILQKVLSLKKEEENILKQQAIQIKDKLEQNVYNFVLKSKGVNVFGSVSSKELIEKINSDEKLINKYMLIDFHPLHAGYHLVKIKITNDVIAEIKVNVEVENA